MAMELVLIFVSVPTYRPSMWTGQVRWFLAQRALISHGNNNNNGRDQQLKHSKATWLDQ